MKTTKAAAPPESAGASSPLSGTFSEIQDACEFQQGESIAVAYAGSAPTAVDAPAESTESRLKAFQSNLLSLVSHELRTPLMGVLNSLSLLKEGFASSELRKRSPEISGMPVQELLDTAARNALRLERNLASLLDLAAIESMNFHLRMKELDLQRVVQARVTQNALKGLPLEIRIEDASPRHHAVLGDPAKLGRAVDLVFELFEGFGARKLTATIDRAEASFESELSAESQEEWESSWEEAGLAAASGLGSPASAFASGGVIAQATRSEEAFLGRSREGLGTEMLLLHEIVRRHGGTLSKRCRPSGGRRSVMELHLALPLLSSDESLRKVLSTRALAVSNELQSVGLVMIRIPEALEAEAFQTSLRQALFRSSDQAYATEDGKRVVLVLDDCKREDIPKLMQRIQKNVGTELRFGIASCPEDGLDPTELLSLASGRMK